MSNLRRSHQHSLRFVLCLALCQTFLISPATAHGTAPLAHPDQPAKRFCFYELRQLPPAWQRTLLTLPNRGQSSDCRLFILGPCLRAVTADNQWAVITM